MASDRKDGVEHELVGARHGDTLEGRLGVPLGVEKEMGGLMVCDHTIYSYMRQFLVNHDLVIF